MKNITVILRMTDDCNLSCLYCYDKINRIKDRDINRKFLNNIDKIIKYIKSFNRDESKNLNLILHGGEPLLLNDNIYEIFLGKVRKNIKNVSISIQTNGTLLTKKKMEILNKYNVRIGISLDGSDEYQNQNRVYENGISSFKEVEKSIKMLKENNIRFGIIITISKYNINKEEDIYNFIKKNAIYCNIRPAFPTKQGPNNFIIAADEYINFFKKMFDLWYYDNTRTVGLKQINEFYDEIVKILEPDMYRGTCENSMNCFGNFISLDINGNVHTCNRTYGDKNFYLGNLNETALEDILKKCNEMCERRKNKLDNSQCSQCEILKFCYGGCPANSYYLYNDYTEPFLYACKVKKYIYFYIKQKLESEGQIFEYNSQKRKENIY